MVAFRAWCPLRMRVSISPSGSVITIFDCPSLPARLDHAGDLPGRGQLSDRDARYLELAIVGPRTTSELAPVVDADLGGVARQLRQLETCGEALLHRQRLVLCDLLLISPLCRVALGHALALLVPLDFTRRRHFYSPSRLIRERHVEALEQGFGFTVGSGRGHDHDIHAAHRVDLVVVDLRKHDLLLEAE